MYNTRREKAEEALWNEPCLAAKVRRLHRVVVGAYDKALRSHRLTVAQLDLLMTLLTADRGLRPAELARALQMDGSTLSRNLARLRRRGLVTGGEGPGSRPAVTPAGRRAAEDAAEAWLGAQRATAALLGPDGVAALDLLIRRLTSDHKEERKP